MTRVVPLVVFALAAISAPALRGQSIFQFTPVLMTGDPAPGLSATLVDEIGAYVDIFNDDPFGGGPDIGATGDVGIVGQTGGDGRPATRDGSGSAVWRATSGGVALVAATGDAAPGTDGLLFTGFPNLSASTAFDHSDGIALRATAAASGSFDRTGLWSTRGQLHRLLLDGEHLPGTPAGTTMFSQFAFVSRGSSVVAEARWCVGGGCAYRDEGLFRDRTGALQPVVIRGTPAAGISGAVFDDVSNASAGTGPIDHWNANERGEVIFNGYVVGSRINGSNNEGLWIETPAGLRLLAREGNPVPDRKGWKWGAASGFRSFGDFTVMATPVATSNGLALWGASINGSKYNRLGGVWSTRTGTVKQLVQTVTQFGLSGEPPLTLATPAPGFEAGSRFRQVFSGRMNDAGAVFLDTDVVRASDPSMPVAAIYRLRAGSDALERVAHAGGAVPGIPGATFAAIDMGRLFETGEYLWTATIQGAGISTANDRVAFLTSPDGTSAVILRSGDTLDVSGNGTQVRQIARFGTSRDPRSGGASPRQVFEIHFTDGSAGVFVGAPAQ